MYCRRQYVLLSACRGRNIFIFRQSRVNCVAQLCGGQTATSINRLYLTRNRCWQNREFRGNPGKADDGDVTFKVRWLIVKNIFPQPKRGGHVLRSTSMVLQLSCLRAVLHMFCKDKWLEIMHNAHFATPNSSRMMKMHSRTRVTRSRLRAL